MEMLSALQTYAPLSISKQEYLGLENISSIDSSVVKKVHYVVKKQPFHIEGTFDIGTNFVLRVCC